MADPAQFALVMDAAEKEWTLLNLMCIKGGVDSNSADYDSRSVMHVAASTGNLRVVQGLLQVGANVNIRDRCGQHSTHSLSSMTRTFCAVRFVCESCAGE